MTTKNICPICGYDGLSESLDSTPDKWNTFEICACCGWEFGYDNPAQISQYRRHWIELGAEWFDPNTKPPHWNLKEQLARIGLIFDII